MSLSRILGHAYDVGCVVVLAVIGLSAVPLLSGCAPRTALFADAAARGAPPPKITVLQSDVLIVDGQTVRLADAVTPLPSPDARCAAEALASRQAALRLKELVSGVTTVSIAPTGARDSFARPGQR